MVAEQQHIDYQFSGLDDDYTEDDDGNCYGYDGNGDGELSSDNGNNDQGQELVSLSRISMEVRKFIFISSTILRDLRSL